MGKGIRRFDSEVEEVKVSASPCCRIATQRIAFHRERGHVKTVKLFVTNVPAEIEKLLYPNAVTVHPTPTLFYDSLTNQRSSLGLKTCPQRILVESYRSFALWKRRTCSLTRIDMLLSLINFSNLGSLPEFSDAQAKELTVIYQINVRQPTKWRKEEEFLLWRTEFEKALKILTPAQQSEFSRRQMMGRIRREGLIPSLAAAPANLGPLLKLDPRQVQKLNDSKEVACVYIKDRMLIAQQKYIELIFAGLPAVLRGKLKSKLEWESAITA